MPYSRILVATDLSEAARTAAQVASRLGNERTRYRVVHVLPPPPAHEYFPDEPDAARTRARRKTALPVVTSWAQEAGLERVETDVLAGSAPREIAKEASAFLAQLVVVGHRGRSDAPAKLLGRTARAVIHLSPADVLVVREAVPGEARPRLRRVLVATDFQAPSRRAAERALELAKGHESEIELAHVFDDALWRERVSPLLHEAQPDEAWIRERYAVLLSAFAGESLRKATKTLLFGRPGPAIAQHARDTSADLVIAGTHGEGDARMLGSNAEAIAELSITNVLIAR